MAYRYWEGERISLRALRASDAALFRSFDDEVSRNLDGVHGPMSDAKFQSWFEQQQKARFDDSNRWVADDKEGVPVGTIDTFQCNRRHGTFKYGIAVADGHRGMGYASEMIVMTLRYYFLELGYQKVTPHAFAFNEASIRLHEKLGFRLEGRLRSMMYTNGAYHDELHYGMTRDEFAALHGAGR
ncbi:GNAT family N-acetyltransferase [Paenibacillus antri]|uniref:GNAT family N-acetyltransferase n=1 Tax=Paenibacillus antri TaxID=2582848 RepID=A0A5R9GKP7_9BACL|nr:GNAT family protein [Paenibacillus antri]TLS52305.1 GNAT family N-acetyltransferase [Paenibacillus antri]